MLGHDVTLPAVSAVGAPQAPLNRPPAERRVVEGSAESRLPRYETPSMYAAPPSRIQRLSASARQFADVLETTGNVQVASSISGFRPGMLDLYA